MLLGLDTETTAEALHSNDFELHCISISDGENSQTFRTAEDFLNEIDINEHTFIIHNAKFDRRVLRVLGVELPHWEDSLLMSYDWNSGAKTPQGAKSPHSLAAWGIRLGYPKGDHDDFTEYSEEMARYCERDAELAVKVYCYLKERFDSATWSYYQKIEKPFQDVILQLEANGYLIDVDKLEEARQELQAHCDTLLETMREQVGQPVPGSKVKYKKRHEEKEQNGTLKFVGTNDDGDYVYRKLQPFNPNSVDHKAFAIEEIFGATLPNKTESGKPATGNGDIQPLDDGGRTELGKFVENLMEYTDQAKLLGTFVEGMLNNLHDDGRVRANYNQAVTRTGRLSSSNPNLQNLPSKGEGGALIRKAVVAPEGYSIVCADVSQFQYRIAVDLLIRDIGMDYDDVKALYETYQRPDGDIHEANRKLLAGYAPELFNSADGRKNAKIFGFSLLFGAGPQTVSDASPLSLEEAKTVVEAGKQKLGSFEKLKEKYISITKENKGVIRDQYGRRLYYPGVNSKENQERARNERQIFNAIVQGTEATIIKLMGIMLYENLDSRVKICGAVHDEFIFEVPNDIIEETEELIEEIMSASWLTNIPMLGEAEHGSNWKEAKGE
jgi:DNA polymerase-1